MLLNIDILNLTRIIGWALLGLLIFAILYRLLLRKLKQGRLEKELYFILYPIDKEPAHGEIQIYMEVHNPMEIEVSLLNEKGEEIQVIEKISCKKGGNIVAFDTLLVENGIYYYQAKSENQKTKKRIEIKN